jgi:arabinoxylan arabinofuranohydrolase
VFNIFLTPKTDKPFKVNVWLDGPWDNATWKGKKIAEIVVPANAKQEITQFTANVSKYVDNLDKKHAIYLIAEGDGADALFNMSGLGFSSNKKKINRPVAPVVSIAVNGKKIELPTTPVRSTNANGISGYDIYQATYQLPAGTSLPAVTATSNNPNVKVSVTQAVSRSGKAVVKFDYKGVVKTYNVVYASE